MPRFFFLSFLACSQSHGEQKHKELSICDPYAGEEQLNEDTELQRSFSGLAEMFLQSSEHPREGLQGWELWGGFGVVSDSSCCPHTEPCSGGFGECHAQIWFSATPTSRNLWQVIINGFELTKPSSRLVLPGVGPRV